MYQVKRNFKSEFIPVRGLQYHVQVWGEPAAGKTPLVMVHGWMDVAASFQFMVDALSQDHWVIAPDWRGFGLTQTPHTDNFWFPDYLADLDQLRGRSSSRHGASRRRGRDEESGGGSLRPRERRRLGLGGTGR